MIIAVMKKMNVFIFNSNSFHPLFSYYSTKKLQANQKHFKYSGATTDSGGGGTGDSLRHNMVKKGLCSEEKDYLTGYCCLHTLQLLLANPMEKVIGGGGLTQKNAMQAIHAFYDLQDSVDFAVWELIWMKVAEAEGINLRNKVAKIAAPIITRWWTVGEAAYGIINFFQILVGVATEMRNRYTAHQAPNKIASGLLALIKEPVIVSDIQLIASFHECFLNEHFSWFQKGDPDVGSTPGYLARHILLRYFLMHSDLTKLKDDGWKKSGKMAQFVENLNNPKMDSLMDDPVGMVGDDKNNEGKKKTKQITIKSFQERKANKFFQFAYEALEKHYKKYANDLLFLSLYGERVTTTCVAKLLLGKQIEEDASNVYSEIHKIHISPIAFSKFLSEKVQLLVDELSNSHHIKMISEGVLNALEGK